MPIAIGEPWPAWTRGHDPEELRRVAGLFQDHDAGYCRGAFSRIREATVARWLDTGAVAQWGAARCELRGAAAWRPVRKSEIIRDFAGAAAAMMGPGDLLCWRFAGDPAPVAALLCELLQRAEAHGGSLFAYAWQEKREDLELLADLGAKWQGVKIRASSEMVGIWQLGGGRRRRPDEMGADWPALARLGCDIPDVGPLAAALPRLDRLWRDHYSSYNARRSWSALSLRGYGGIPEMIEKPAEMSKAWKKANPELLAAELADTRLRDALPEAEPLIDAIPGAKHRIRLMRLTAGGGELRRHADITDPDAGTADGRLMRIHIPIQTNLGCSFQGWEPDGRRVSAHMGLGEGWYLDTRKPHTARNEGPEPRVHLVMDCEASPALRRLLP